MTVDGSTQEPLRILPVGDDPGPTPAETGLEGERLRELYRLMAFVRAADAEATALQRQGELAVYPPLLGQEAAQVGSAFALDPDDWVFPGFRDMGPALVRGIDLAEYLDFDRTIWHGGSYDPVAHRFAPQCVPVASQILHAVGYAIGTKLDRRPSAVLTYFGDGATSEGAFHEGCNFAGVFGAPVVLFCQNNQWAISVPLDHQTHGAIAGKAAAYGFPGVRVDGNDVLAVHRATAEALARARHEGVPTLIEAVTYRLGPHSTADDPTRYRSAEEVARWEARDPIRRYRRWLGAAGVAGEAFFDAVEEAARALAEDLRGKVTASRPHPVEDLFAWVYAEIPESLARQRDEAVRLAAEGAAGAGEGGRRG